jgi:hypothetical protein
LTGDNGIQYHDLAPLGSTSFSTAGDCATWCTNNTHCESFIFNSDGTSYTGNPKCVFKDSQVQWDNIPGNNKLWAKNVTGFTRTLGANNNMDRYDVAGGDAITDINTCGSTCATTPTCKSFLFNDNGLGGAYGTKKCAFKSSSSAENVLPGQAAFYKKN